MNLSTVKAAALKEISRFFEQFEISVDKPIYYDSATFNEILNIIEYGDISEYEDVSITNGLSKICFLDLIDGYVIKIPLAGTYSYDYNHTTCKREYINKKYKENYCKLETEIYSSIASTLFSDYFLPTEYAGMVGALEIYIQPYATSFTESKVKISDDSYTTAEDYDCYRCFCDDVYVVAAFIEAYGADLTQEIGEFLEFNNITDIHSGNIGYYNGRLIIFDYAGFHN